MSKDLSEEEMRFALFGPSAPTNQTPLEVPKPRDISTPHGLPRSSPTIRTISPKLRVTLHVSREFEGSPEVFTYDANTLSTFVAGQEAKIAAKKKKFQYFELVSVRTI